VDVATSEIVVAVGTAAMVALIGIGTIMPQAQEGDTTIAILRMKIDTDTVAGANTNERMTALADTTEIERDLEVEHPSGRE
jgi:hypothetical protein